jgi:predicted transposase/invertase (TIGR01784 family)
MVAERAVGGISRDYRKFAREMAIMKNRMDRAQMIYDAKQEGLQAGRAEGLQEGRAEGMAQGMAQGMFEVARKMKGVGDSIEKIHIITGLPIETIEKL